LANHDRNGAIELLKRLQEFAPAHRLTTEMRGRLAVYDDNPVEGLAAARQQLDPFPSDDRVALQAHQYMCQLSTRQDRLVHLASLVDSGERCDQLTVCLAAELACDNKTRPRALKLLRKVLRRSMLPKALKVLAGQHWTDGQFVESTLLYRFASCLDDRNEQRARSYFIAEYSQRRMEIGLEFLNRILSSVPPRWHFAGLVSLRRPTAHRLHHRRCSAS
jgi:hypothetical protein